MFLPLWCQVSPAARVSALVTISISGRGVNSVADHKRFEARLNVYVSAEMQRKLEQLRDQRGPQTTVPDVVREAIRLYIDNEEEIIGSRRHFQRSLREHLDSAKTELFWTDLVMLAFVWQLLHPVLNATTKNQVTFKETWDRALSFAQRSGTPYLKTLEDALEQAFIVKPTESK
jgi:Arc/MetJ-type ribon-helix-helix transcriptional regulator